ncbi:MAG: hypothetical protein ACRD8O_12990 [Bryobacteraceae bacterium]
MLARKDLLSGNEFPDLVVRHPLLAQFRDTRLASGKLLAEGLLLHLVEAGLESFLRVLPVVVDDGARRDDAGGKQSVGVQTGESQRGDGRRQRHDLVGERVRNKDARDPQGYLAEFLQQVGVLAEPADQAAQTADHRLQVILELGPNVFPKIVELAPHRPQLAFDRLRGGRVRTLDLRALKHHRVVPDLLLLGSVSARPS